jgi:hypothetical protein
MGAPGYFVAAGLFMIAAAILWGQGITARGHEESVPQTAAAFAVVVVLFLLAKGVQEQNKEKP